MGRAGDGTAPSCSVSRITLDIGRFSIALHRVRSFAVRPAEAAGVFFIERLTASLDN